MMLYYDVVVVSIDTYAFRNALITITVLTNIYNLQTDDSVPKVAKKRDC